MNNKRNRKTNSVLSDNQKRALILEKRLARLEHLMKNEATKRSVKNESSQDEVYDAAAQWARDYIDQLDGDDYWVQKAGSIRKALQVIADEAADPIVDECCDDLEYEYGFKLSSSDRDVIASALASEADDAMRWIADDDWDEDDDYDESLKRRIASLEKAISNKKRTVESKRPQRKLKNR